MHLTIETKEHILCCVYLLDNAELPWLNFLCLAQLKPEVTWCQVGGKSVTSYIWMVADLTWHDLPPCGRPSRYTKSCNWKWSKSSQLAKTESVLFELIDTIQVIYFNYFILGFIGKLWDTKTFFRSLGINSNF